MKVFIPTKDGKGKIVNLNRRKAIREKCRNCSAWSWKEVENCQFVDCALYPFRSGIGKQNAEDRSRAIRKYCLWCMGDQSREIAKCTSPDCPLFPYRKSGIDRSVEIKTLPIDGHIQAVNQVKNEEPYQHIGASVNICKTMSI